LAAPGRTGAPRLAHSEGHASDDRQFGVVRKKLRVWRAPRGSRRAARRRAVARLQTRRSQCSSLSAA